MQDITRDTDPDKYFYLVNGKQVKNAKELLREVKEMSKSDFDHHVNAERNDFSNWIKHVFGEADLADRLTLAQNKTQFAGILEQYINAASSAPVKVQEKVQGSGSAKSVSKTSKTSFGKVSASSKKPDPKKRSRKTTKVTKKENKQPVKKTKKPVEKTQPDFVPEKLDEINKREQKVLEVEHMLEKRLEEIQRGQKYQFEEFVQGLLVGAIIGFVFGLMLLSV